MSKSFIQKYLLEQKEGFFRNYDLALKKPGFDSIHDLRVAVKRLTTLVNMLNFKEKANYRLKKSLLPIRFVYKQFGKIRDIQVLLLLLENYQDKSNIDFSSLITYCKKQKRKNKEHFFIVASSFKIKTIRRTFRLVEKHLDSKDEAFFISKVVAYKQNREERFSKFANNGSKRYDLHKARRMAKEICYLMEMVKTRMPDFAAEYSYYKKIGSLLGDWHDCEVLYNYLYKLKKQATFDFNFDGAMQVINSDKTELEGQFFKMIQ